MVEDGSRDENNKRGVRAPFFNLCCLSALLRQSVREKPPTYPTPSDTGV
jgi:hypothetical protein